MLVDYDSEEEGEKKQKDEVPVLEQSKAEKGRKRRRKSLLVDYDAEEEEGEEDEYSSEEEQHERDDGRPKEVEKATVDETKYEETSEGIRTEVGNRIQEAHHLVEEEDAYEETFFHPLLPSRPKGRCDPILEVRIVFPSSVILFDRLFHPSSSL
jgi:hypothetical protein